MKVSELRNELKKLGLDHKGLKAQLTTATQESAEVEALRLAMLGPFLKSFFLYGSTLFGSLIE